MSSPTPRLAELSDNDRRVLESWLVEFNRRWEDGLLANRVDQMPPGSSWRLPALAEMVKIDLERQWARGQQISLESYLEQYPELGRADDVSADLIQAEYEVRKQFGAPVALEDYLRRFPHQAAELGRLIAQRTSAFTRRLSASDPPDSSFRARRSGETPEPFPRPFGRYQLLKRLGEGGMGSVFLAEDTTLGRPVALKIPLLGSEEGSEGRERFFREARAAATLDHPYLCPVHDVGEIDGRLYLTMAYIDGQSLAESTRGKSLPPRQVAALVGKLALALQEAHAKGVIHRDLKPSNVMIKSTGTRREPVIVDFGLARRDDASEARLTKTGQVMGTLDYMAPEQLRGELKEIGPACDIYALGVILYELLTGRLPFEGSGLAVVGQILTQNPLLPSELRPDLDPRLEAICLKAMAKKISDRYASMAALAAALTDFLKAASSKSTPGTPAPPTTGEAPRETGSHSLVGQMLGQLADTIVSPRPPIPPPPMPGTQPVGTANQGSGKRPPPWPMIAAAGMFGVVLLVVIISVATNKGTIKIEVENSKNVVVVKVDDEEVRIKALDEPITLRPGKHEIEVRWGDRTFRTARFAVMRGDGNDAVRIEYEPAGGTDRLSIKAESPIPAPAVGGIDGVFTSAAKTPAEELVDKPPAPPVRVAGIKLKLIPAGEFLMGSSKDEDKDKDALLNEMVDRQKHRVLITRAFYLGVTEVTQGQYRAVTGQSPSHFKGSDDLPVESVSWLDAVAFCNALSRQEGLPLYYRIEGYSVEVPDPKGSGYRLPTEAEWEYACRARGSTRFSFGDDPASLERLCVVQRQFQQSEPPGGPEQAKCVRSV